MDNTRHDRGPANERQVGGDHYKSMGIQHWTYILANDIPYMEAQIIKYVTRWRRKGGIQDLEKARHFLDKLLEWEKDKAQQLVEQGDSSSRHVEICCSLDSNHPSTGIDGTPLDQDKIG